MSDGAYALLGLLFILLVIGLVIAFIKWNELGRQRPTPPAPVHLCSKCSTGQLVRVSQKTDEGTGCIVAVLGLVLTPILLGIPLLFYGLHLHGKVKSHWHCRGCGTVFPA